MGTGSDAGTDQDQVVAEIVAAADIQSIEAKLTQAMAQQRIQSVIKDGNLDVICTAISRLAKVGGSEGVLLAAAALGRLAAVARGRESRAWSALEGIFVDVPPPIESLQSGDAKTYAAQSLRHVPSNWVTKYCVQQAIDIESADNARREFLLVALERCGSVSSLVSMVRGESGMLKSLELPDTRVKRSRRIITALAEAIATWEGEIGENPGGELSKLVTVFLKGNLDRVDEGVLFDLLDRALAILARVIEMRFSCALRGETYEVLQQAKGLLGGAGWGLFLRSSRASRKVRVNLLEAALVIARQNRTDKEIQLALAAACGSRTEMLVSIRHHFGLARDLDPATRDWWLGKDEEQGSPAITTHKMGNTEDQQIGNLLIEVESTKEAMEKVKRAVIPLLEISDPVLAATLKKASSSHAEMAQVIRRLARMRKLTPMGISGERMEYNPLEHEMVGGHKPGTRWVKVVRDGVRKDFAGTAKTLVKPWVEVDRLGGQ